MSTIQERIIFPPNKVYASLGQTWKGKREIVDRGKFCHELEEYLKREESSSHFPYYHRVKVNSQAGFFLNLRGEAVPVFSSGLFRNLEKIVCVSAETRNGFKFLTVSVDGKTNFTTRIYDSEHNRFYFRRRNEPQDKATYILTVGPENELEFLGYKCVFNFEWRPGDIVLAQVANKGFEGFVGRDRHINFPVTRAFSEVEPTILLVGELLGAQQLARVSGTLEKELRLNFHNQLQCFCFWLGGKTCYITKENLKDFPNPLKARVKVTLENGKIKVLEVSDREIRRRINFILVRNKDGVVRASAERRIGRLCEEETQIVEGHFSRMDIAKIGRRSHYSEVLAYAGGKKSMGPLAPAEADRFSPDRYSFIFHRGKIHWVTRATQLGEEQLNLYKYRAYYLADWISQREALISQADSFYRNLVVQKPDRDFGAERSCRIKRYSQIVEVFEGTSTSEFSDVDYKEAAALIFAMEYIFSGKSMLTFKKVKAISERKYILLTEVKEETLSRALAWLWYFEDAQRVLLNFLLRIDIRHREFGRQLLQSFSKDPFLWDEILQRLTAGRSF